MPDLSASFAELLLPLRQQIDDIDQQLLALLAQRFRVTNEVGHIKAEHALPAIDAAREAAQMLRIADRANALGLDAGLAQCVFRLVIDHVVENHRVIAATNKQAD